MLHWPVDPAVWMEAIRSNSCRIFNEPFKCTIKGCMNRADEDPKRQRFDRGQQRLGMLRPPRFREGPSRRPPAYPGIRRYRRRTDGVLIELGPAPAPRLGPDPILDDKQLRALEQLITNRAFFEAQLDYSMAVLGAAVEYDRSIALKIRPPNPRIGGRDKIEKLTAFPRRYGCPIRLGSNCIASTPVSSESRAGTIPIRNLLRLPIALSRSAFVPLPRAWALAFGSFMADTNVAAADSVCF
jgi:hypothetical protein